MASGEVFVFCDLFQDGIEVLATILIFPLAAFFFFTSHFSAVVFLLRSRGLVGMLSVYTARVIVVNNRCMNSSNSSVGLPLLSVLFFFFSPQFHASACAMPTAPTHHQVLVRSLACIHAGHQRNGSRAQGTIWNQNDKSPYC